MKNQLEKLAIFEMNAGGRVIADLSNDALMPIVQFADGNACFGLPRETSEVEILGYKSIAEANFIHEAVHLFITSKIGSLEASVAYRAGLNADFTDPAILEDAKDEEMIVLGFQAHLNDALGDCVSTNKVNGFCLHIVGAAIKFSADRLFREFGFTLNQLRDEFLELLAESNFKVGCRCDSAAVN